LLKEDEEKHSKIINEIINTTKEKSLKSKIEKTKTIQEKTKNLSESYILKCAKEIYNKYKHNPALAVKIIEKYLKKLGIKNPEEIINKILKQ